MQRTPEPEVMADRQEARAYDLANFQEVDQQIADRVVERFNPSTGRIIDLGTGPAGIPVRIRRALPRCRILAVDASDAMLERAAARAAAASAGPAIALLRADAAKLPLPDASFDAVISNSLLHHLADPHPFWREVKRLARPGGLLFVEDLCRPDSRADAARIVETHSGDEPKLLRDLFYQSLLAAFTVEEVRRQLAATGLDHLEVAAIDDRHLLACGPAR